MKLYSKYALGLASIMLTACAAISAPHSSATNLEGAFRVATYNIRCPIDKTPNSWEERAGPMRALIQRHNFDLNASDTFWLSETPDVVGSKSWDTACTRICTWARLTDRVTGRQFVIFNAHLDHKSAAARENRMKLILRRIPDLARGLPVILTGDLNATPKSAPILLARATLHNAAELSVAKPTGPSGWHV